ncbi:hypothetical protein P154DRAFT_616189 [Amniculicola lignicola CBS 123094]|uniref:Uncharacterized protein n=1 Tax=Amniculicola lignicola CBS 123094 TaxID=1392246 RepID=A0A6A5WYD0_9PLEO|nr:hypothetical protein P154DRAFT_616189 [Amniculicola lignicola CBS 123094]
MAPVPSPPQAELDLAKCFAGEDQLVSWEVAYTALCDPQTAAKSEPLRAFLTAPANIDILSTPWSPFPEPSRQEQNKFETATAPVNLPSIPNGPYNVDELKADALWLSEQARISEYAALRLVVLEWQSRPAAQLLSGFSEEEALSVQEAAGVARLGMSNFLPNSSITNVPFGLPLRSDAQPDSSDSRKLRLLSIYNATSISILRISQLLLSWSAARNLRKDYGDEYRVCEDWLEYLGQDIAAKQNQSVARAGRKTLDNCIEAISRTSAALEGGFSWDVPEPIAETAIMAWNTARVTEMVHLLHIAIVHVDLYTTNFVPAATIEDWINLAMAKGFFKNFGQLVPDQPGLASLLELLASLLSLAILKVDMVLNDLETGQYTAWDRSSYVLNGTIVTAITKAFGDAKQLGPSAATPAAFAWAIIGWRLTEQATALEREREHQIESGTGGNTYGTSPLEEATMALNSPGDANLFNGKPPPQDIAETCSEFGVMSIIATLVELGMSAFGTAIDQISRDRFRLLFLQLIRASLGTGIVAYSPELISVTHTILTGDRTFRQWSETDTQRHADPVVSYFLKDETILRPELLEEARLRYPYEMIPLLKFCSLLARGEKATHGGLPTVAAMLRDTTSLMQRLPDSFNGYVSIREEENANWVQLTVPLPQFASGPVSSLRGTKRLLSSASSASSEEVMVVPEATVGTIVDDSAPPFVALWQYPHSALEYFVRLLSTYTVGNNSVEYATQEPVTLDIATDIIGFLADLLHSSMRASATLDEDTVVSAELLSTLDIDINHNQDTANIVLSIFEQALLQQCQTPGSIDLLELLVNCIHFLDALVAIAPNRVWPWLVRSRLLEGDGSGGSLASILIGTEMVLGRYDFLIGCIQLFDTLVQDAVGRSVARKASTKALTRFGAVATVDSGTSDRIISNTLLTFGRTLASIYEGCLEWKYTRKDDKIEINEGICGTFNSILEFAYGVDDSPKLSSKITGLVAPIADYLVELYLSTSKSNMPTNPLMAALASGTNLDKSSLLPTSAALGKQRTHTTLVLCNLLVRIAVLLDKPWTHLEQQLFKATPLLARLYAANDSYKSPVVLLLESLVRGAARIEKSPSEEGSDIGEKKPSEPPSLLGHLGPRTAKNFLSVLSQLDEPLKIVDVQINVWSLLSAVVTCKQQWFSLYLLTGSTPRESVQAKSAPGSDPLRSKALLSRALDSLSKMDFEQDTLPWPLYIAMLEFVCSAQNKWSWAMGDLRQHKPFIDHLLAFLKWMASQRPEHRTDLGVLAHSYQNKFASLVCEILAMYLHGARQRGDVTPLNSIIPALTYLEIEGLKEPQYNPSLHPTLKKHVEHQFQGVSLANFKRTTLYPARFGRSFFYDIDLANKLLGFNPQWEGRQSGQGFCGEVIKANHNLGLVETQVQLLSGWKVLALELSNVLVKDERLVKVLVDVVQKCMETNATSTLSQALFGQLMVQRADVAFALLQKMVIVKVNTPEARRLLPAIWSAIRASIADFDTVFSSDQADYYRSLLRILYLALQFHRLSPNASEEDTSFRQSFMAAAPRKFNEPTEPISNQLLEILVDSVAKGFRSLATQLHAEPHTVSPSDFGLLTAILQTIIAIPEMLNWLSQAALLFSNSGTIRYATSLFSWADRLTLSSNGVADPIYGELSLLFILSLSNMQPLAETMAVEGILSQLSAANLMNYYRRSGGMSPFDTPARVYTIWSKGILPLCLNLLDSVGPAIAGEIAAFLNQFPEQLSRASNALNSKYMSKITLSIASEIHSLALISAILEQTRSQGPRLGIQASDIPVLDWNREIVKEDVEYWLSRKASLAERVVCADESDEAAFGRKVQGPGTENLLEERIVRELDAAGDCLGVGKGSTS